MATTEPVTITQKLIYNTFIDNYLKANNLTRTDVFKKTRFQHIIKHRQVIFTVLRENILTYNEISAICLSGVNPKIRNSFHHTTVRHSIERINTEKELYKNDIGVLYKNCKRCFINTLLAFESDNIEIVEKNAIKETPEQTNRPTEPAPDSIEQHIAVQEHQKTTKTA